MSRTFLTLHLPIYHNGDRSHPPFPFGTWVFWTSLDSAMEELFFLLAFLLLGLPLCALGPSTREHFPCPFINFGLDLH